MYFTQSSILLQSPYQTFQFIGDNFTIVSTSWEWSFPGGVSLVQVLVYYTNFYNRVSAKWQCRWYKQQIALFTMQHTIFHFPAYLNIKRELTPHYHQLTYHKKKTSVSNKSNNTSHMLFYLPLLPCETYTE